MWLWLAAGGLVQGLYLGACAAAIIACSVISRQRPELCLGKPLLAGPEQYCSARANGQSSTDSASSSGSKLRLLTHNVWAHYFATPMKQPHAGVAFPVMRGVGYEARLKALAAHIGTDGCDVVCVQELFLLRLGPFVFAANFRLFARLLAAEGYVHHTDPTTSLPLLFGQNYGVAIFSKLPLQNEHSETYTHSAEKLLNAKGFVCASVLLETVEVVLVSVHTDARNWASKEKQLEQVKNRILCTRKQSSSKQIECVAVGDFNVCLQTEGNGGFDDGSQYTSLIGKMESNNMQDAWTAKDSEPTEGEASLDHIFFDSTAWKLNSKQIVKYKDGSGESVSDHLGLMVHLELCVRDREETRR
jgi:endonuclease/exonuclease/phosphatase family metal-dependent hydrolase